MMELTASKALRGEVTVPGDKSISHRSVMFGAIAQGTTEVTKFLQGADCLSTISCFQKLGIEIENTPERILVHGKGLHGLSAPSEVLDAGNSGTTTRLISGILSGQTFETTLTGDASIQKRPMKRIMEPLSLMGAKIESVRKNGCAPLHITGSSLHGITYSTPVASAQVKSSILLAGLYADGQTSVTEPALSRNHTELMLSGFGADICSDGLTATITPGNELYAQQIFVPGDISSAAYFLAAGLLVPGSELLIRNVGINPTRTGVIDILRLMGANIEIRNPRLAGGEPVADLRVRYAPLHGIRIPEALVPLAIDEFPALFIAAACAKGVTVLTGAAELRVKESDRIQVMADGLNALQIAAGGTADGIVIQGGTLAGGAVNSHGDHRIAMSFAMAALRASGPIRIHDCANVNTSFPGFADLARSAGLQLQQEAVA